LEAGNKARSEKVLHFVAFCCIAGGPELPLPANGKTGLTHRDDLWPILAILIYGGMISPKERKAPFSPRILGGGIHSMDLQT
jgi:hypothetical protein